MEYIEEGNPASPLWLVGEAPGFYEDRRRRPFVGPTGDILNSCLGEVGIARSDCFLTNICHTRPPTYRDKHGKRIENDINQFFLTKQAARAAAVPERFGRYPDTPIQHGLARLSQLIATHHPRIVVLLGNTALWGITGEQGITKWRGSVIDCGGVRTIACFHPADCLPNRSPEYRPLIIHDLHRAKRELACPSAPPQWDHCIAPSLADVHDWLGCYATHGEPLTCDLETRGGQIACVGLASSNTAAICIPFSQAQPGEHGYSYWSLEDEIACTSLIDRSLTQPGAGITFHHGLFDCQYLARQWGIVPRYTDDTMVMQHVAFPGFLGGKIDPVSGRVDKRGSSLSLSFISSLYCKHYRFWKDDGRLFDPLTDDEAQLWRYNCEDCCRTRENQDALTIILERAKLVDQYRFEMNCIPLTLRMMWRGLRVDREEMNAQYAHILHGMRQAREWLNTVTGTDFNPESTPQMRALFYNDLQVPIRYDKHSRQPSLKDFDLEQIKRQNPLLSPLIEQIQDYRTLSTIKNDVATEPYYDKHKGRMHYPLSTDGRLRNTLNPDYVETMRYCSSETAFCEGGNLQNIPRSPED